MPVLEETRVDRAGPPIVRVRGSATSHWYAVSQLLETRRELQGVCPLADLVHEAVRWAV